MRVRRSFMTAALMALAVVLIQAQEVKVPLRFDFYYSYEKVGSPEGTEHRIP
jgi:hypothetical protein